MYTQRSLQGSSGCSSSRSRFDGASSSSSPRPLSTPPSAVKISGAKHVVCSKTLTAVPERREQVAQVLKEILTYTEQRAKDKESGILSFSVVRDQWDPDTFHCYEKYANNAAAGRHNTDPVMNRLMQQKIRPNLQGPMGWAMYEWKNGKLGSCCVPEGPKGEGGLDDATGASGGAGGASMKRSSAATPVIAGLENDHADEKGALKLAAKPKELMANVKKGLESFFSFGKISRNS